MPILACALVALIIIAAWFTHIIVSLATMQWGFLVAGAIAGVIGVIHGIGIWLGAW